MAEKFKSGFVVLMGRPNVGKSTLLNTLLGEKISIVSDIPQTTRYQIRGILNLKDAQIVFLDTPGIHAFREELAAHLNTITRGSLEDIDVLLYVVDVSRHVGKEEQEIMKLVVQSKAKVIMVLNKVDQGSRYLNEYIDAWKHWLKSCRVTEDPVQYYITISAENSNNIDGLKKAVLELLPEHEPFYPKEYSTDFPLQFRVADTIREKLFLHLKEEVPHFLAVIVEEMKDKGKIIYVGARIYVARETHRIIILGKEGSFIKEVGIAARKDLETLLKKKVFLELKVVVKHDWQTNPHILRELGYWVG